MALPRGHSFIQIFAVSGLVSGQISPSFPDEKIWNYEIPMVSNEVKSLTEILKVASEENDSLKE